VLEALRRLLGRKPPEPGPEEAAELAAAFKERYRQFRLLLAANNKALEIMSEMEEALGGGRPFGMSFVRSRSTAAAVNVHQMVRSLDALAPGRYPGLEPRFHELRGAVRAELARSPAEPAGPLVLELGEIGKEQADAAGAKMANLGEVRGRVGLDTPPGFAVTARAMRRFFAHHGLDQEIARRITAFDPQRPEGVFKLSSEIMQLIVAAELPAEVAEAIAAAYASLEREAHPGVTVAVRSSALGEDAAGASFAGQYRSQLNVRGEHLALAYREVVASLYSPQAMTYRLGRGIPDEEAAMYVGVLAMVEAAAGGVAYTCDPLNLRDRRVQVHSAWGLPKGVVDGEAEADLFVVEREPLAVAERRLGDKQHQFRCYAEEGVCRLESAGPEASAPSLDDGQVLAVAAAALKLEEHYGAPQDVEWAWTDDGRLWMLQCRPLQQQEAPAGSQRPTLEGAEALAVGGVTASPGAAAGPVHWVRKESDALAFPQGAVLAAETPRPRLAALLGRAAAVVTAQGGAAGHLANVAREFGVPALMGLGAELSRLEQGEEITVDAEGRAVYRGRVAELLALAPARPNLMAGSPVHRALQAAAGLITPLTLLDPDSPEFKPGAAQTLHDLTRFCHEKSVHEMFSFGKRQSFPRRAAKQLYHGRPMQWWVINLDDGFHQEVEGKYVELENIACRPMLALWEGMSKIPWQGPPAVHGRGLASVMFQATANPALVPGVKSSYANLNYFMISKSFMSLHSRFGFHFSTVESLVDERPGENYLSFTFKGGAADLDRRLARVRFISELLEESGFAVRVREDMLAARLEGLEAGDMEQRVKLVGYLIMHTRQLDMVMSDPAAVERYRRKMRDDLRTLCGETACGVQGEP
jgi:pyruvate,water dikinase